MNRRISSLLRLTGLALATALIAGCQTTTPLTWKLPDGVKTVQANGYPLAYAETGSGPTLVILPGILCDYRCFPGQAALANDHRVVTVSLRHTFPEPWDGTGSDYNLRQHAKDVTALLQTLNPPVVLVGHSFGGAIALRVARDRPELVSKLVLAEAATEGVFGADPTIAQTRAAAFADRTESLIKSSGAEAGAAFAMDAINGEGTWAKFPPPIRSIIAANVWTAVAWARDPGPRGDCADLAALKMPVLILTGQATGPAFKALVPQQGQCARGSKTVTIPGVGHSVQMNPPAFNAALREFMR